MIVLTKTLSVDLIDVFVARRTCGKPSTPRNRLQPADGPAVAQSLRQDALDRLANQLYGQVLL